MQRTAPRPHAGFTLVELLVACALGLAVGAVALSLFAQQVRTQREQLVEARLHQDLSAATDLIVRGLRRAGHRGLTASTAVNPYRALDIDAASITFGHSRDAVEDDRLDARERAGFRLADGVLQAQLGGRWQALTDPAVITIDRFDVTLEERRAPAECAAVLGRAVRVALVARPTDKRAPSRRLEAFVALRNDDIDAVACAHPS